MDKNPKRMASININTQLTKKHKEDKVPKLITDLNVDCLMQIFSTFSIKDLVHVVEAYSSLLTAAQGVFHKNYSQTVVEVSNVFHPKQQDTSLSVKLIKHFGAKITKLKVVYFKKFGRFNDMLDNVILNQCTQILSEIEIENGDELVFHNIDKAFHGLHKISFVSSDVPNVLLHFEKWFPKAKVLELKKLKIDKKGNKKAAQEYYEVSDAENDSKSETGSDSESSGGFYGKPIAALAKHYPTVEHFAISNVPMVYKRDNRLRNRDIEKFIKLNPQLKSFFIESDDIDHECEGYWSEAGHSVWSYDGIEINEELAECIQENLTNLENFHLIWKTGDSNEGCEIHFKKISTLTVDYDIRSGHFYVGTGNVDVLNIVGQSDSNEYFADLLKSNKTAKIVSITGVKWNDKHVESARKRIAKMSNLRELQLSYESLTKQQIVRLLNSSTSLSKLTLDFAPNLKSFVSQSKKIDADIDLTEIGWESSHKNTRLVLNRIKKT